MIVGIDLGTTNSLLGVMEAGFPILVADATGARLTPSVVRFPESGGPVVGRDALSGGGEVVFSVKRLMGHQKSVGQTGKTPEEISALILKKLKADAERTLGVSVDRAVITVPAYFNENQRAATKRAGELAGFTVERLLAEPTAAALAYGLDRLGDRTKIAVFDLGGGTFDISLLELSGGVFNVLSTNGDTRLGGDDFDAALAVEYGLSLPAARVLRENPASSEAPDSTAGIEAVCLPILERTRPLCLRALQDAGLTPEDLDAVVLVGGATRMPLVRTFVRDLFEREPNTSQHPDETVALGAVIQAGILDGAVRNVTLLDVTPLSLGIETFGGLMNILIPRNTTIPCKAGEMFTNAAANQASMRISVLQGEREMARDNWCLGAFDLAFTPAPRAQARVGVQFEIDASGLLHVLARDVATGTDTTIALQNAVEVSDEAVEKMLADSLEHAFEDMDDRQFAEACLKADEMLPAVTAALERLGPLATPEEHSTLNALLEKVGKAREARSLQKLKAALTELDRVTEPLAARLVEAVMEGRV